MEGLLILITDIQMILLTARRYFMKLTRPQALKNYLLFIEAEALTLLPVLSQTNPIQALFVQHELFHLPPYFHDSSKKPVSFKLFGKHSGCIVK